MNYKHGLAHTRIDTIYKRMIERCYKSTVISFPRYGGRNIKVCDEWRRDKTKFFEWAFSHGYSERLTLERVDNDKGYSPENCKWATVKEQNNNRRSSRYLEAFGKRQTLAQWSDETGLQIATIWARLNRGWSVERSLTEEVADNGRKCRRDC